MDLKFCTKQLLFSHPVMSNSLWPPWTPACQAYLSRTISWSLPKFIFIALVMLSSHLTLWCPRLFLPSIFPWLFGKESTCNAGVLGLIPVSWKFHGQRSLMGYSPWGGRVGHDWAHTHDSQVFFLSTTPLFLPTNQKHKAKDGTLRLSVTTDKLLHTCTKAFKLISSQ